MGGVVRETDAVVIGGGQAGLSTSYWLRRYGVPFVTLDANPGPGGAWQHRWPSLRLDLAHRVHDLPGLAMGGVDASRPSSEVVSEYFARYEREFALPVVRPVPVRAVRRMDGDGDGDGTGGRLLVETDRGDWAARAVVNATGTWTRPFVPYVPGAAGFRGRQLHVADYRSAEEFRGMRVLVVGGGASGVQLLAEIEPVAAGTVWVTRRPPVWRDTEFTEQAGRAAVGLVEARVRAGLPPGSVVSVTGLAATPAVAAARARGVYRRRPMITRITRDGVRWADGSREDVDVILWATGFRAALDQLAPLGLRERGGGIRMLDGTRVAAEPRLFLVGYGPSASTVGAGRAGRAAARAVRVVTGGSAFGGSAPASPSPPAARHPARA